MISMQFVYIMRFCKEVNEQRTAREKRFSPGMELLNLWLVGSTLGHLVMNWWICTATCCASRLSYLFLCNNFYSGCLLSYRSEDWTLNQWNPQECGFSRRPSPELFADIPRIHDVSPYLHGFPVFSGLEVAWFGFRCTFGDSSHYPSWSHEQQGKLASSRQGYQGKAWLYNGVVQLYGDIALGYICVGCSHWMVPDVCLPELFLFDLDVSTLKMAQTNSLYSALSCPFHSSLLENWCLPQEQTCLSKYAKLVQGAITWGCSNKIPTSEVILKHFDWKFIVFKLREGHL